MKNSVFSISLLDNRYPALHGIRTLLILLTAQMHVFLHVALATYIGDSSLLVNLLRLSLNGSWPSMDLFFVMSGFLIGRILIRSFDLKKGDAIRFYWRRALRTIPLYYVSLLLLAGVVQIWPQVSVNGVTQINWVPEFLYLSNYMKDKPLIAPWSWSMSVEEHFYLIGPWLIYLMCLLPRHWQRLTFLSLLGFVALGLRLYKYESTAQTSINIFKDLYILTHLRFDTFTWGILAAYLSYYFPEQMTAFYKKRIVRWCSWVIVILLTLLFIDPKINQYPFMYLSYGGPASDEVVRDVALKGVFYFGFISSIVFVNLIFLFLYTNNFIVRFLSLPFFRVFGTLSYGFYLVHFPIANILIQLVIQYFPIMHQHRVSFWIICFLLTSILSYLLSYILHLLVEKPILVLRDRYFP